MRRLALVLALALAAAGCGGSGGDASPTPTPAKTPAATQALPDAMQASLEDFIARLRSGRPTCSLRAQRLLEAESGRTGSAAARACKRRTPGRDTSYASTAAADARLLSASGGRARVGVPSKDGTRRFLLVREHGHWKVLGIGRATP
jgi:hypothetical protein